MKPQMLAANIIGPQRIQVQEVAVPDVNANEVLIAIEGCGVCGSNLPTWEGRPWFEYPFGVGAPGHEGWGRVAAVGKDVSNVKEGDRVAAISYHAFAEYDVAAAANVVLLPPNLDGRDFPGEALACAMNIFERAKIRGGDRVAVVGVGFLGALLVQLAARAGAEVFGFGRRADGLAVAKSFGAQEAMRIPEPGEGEALTALVEASGSQGFDVVIECVGQQAALDLATRLCKISARLVIAGFHQDGLRQIDLCSWNWRALEIVNAHVREPQAYVRGLQQAVEAVTEGRLVPDTLYTHRYPLEEAGNALALLLKRPPGFMKASVVAGRAA